MITGDASETYKRFEDRFRGARETVMARLQVYAPILEIVERASGAGRALDLGCGRGEWMEMIAGRGWRAIGVDLNHAMGREARATGLDVHIGDALEYLQGVAPASLRLVSAMHVVEHVSHAYLAALIAAAQVALEPGGLLIFETPNPENLSVGAWSFHLDPSHVKPLPPDLLAFLVREGGFQTAEILTLNGALPLREQGPIEQIVWTLFTAAPDYAIVAMKAAPDVPDARALHAAVAGLTQPRPANIVQVSHLARVADQTAASLGGQIMDRLEAVHHSALQHDKLILAQAAELAARAEAASAIVRQHHDQANERLLRLAEQAVASEVQLVHLSREVQAATSQAGVAAALAREVLQTNEAIHRKLETSLEQLGTELSVVRAERAHFEQLSAGHAATIDEIRRSTSWRMTAPVRGAGMALRALLGGVEAMAKGGGKALLRGPLEAALRWGRRHPAMARFAMGTLGRLPFAGPRLRRFARVRGYVVERTLDGATAIQIDAPPEALAHWRGQLSSGAE